MRNVPCDAAEVVPDQVDDHEVLGLLFGRAQLRLGRGAGGGRRLLDGAFDGAELAGAVAGPGQEALGAAADELDVLRCAGSRLHVEVGAERRWVCCAQAEV